jgi:hypothetical protein
MNIKLCIYYYMTLYMYTLRILDYVILIQFSGSPSVFVRFRISAYSDSAFLPKKTVGKIPAVRTFQLILKGEYKILTEGIN